MLADGCYSDPPENRFCPLVGGFLFSTACQKPPHDIFFSFDSGREIPILADISLPHRQETEIFFGLFLDFFFFFTAVAIHHLRIAFSARDAGPSIPTPPRRAFLLLGPLFFERISSFSAAGYPFSLSPFHLLICCCCSLRPLS